MIDRHRHLQPDLQPGIDGDAVGGKESWRLARAWPLRIVEPRFA
jgi:hypothetical protein